jgi:oligoribonuclease
MEIVYKPVELIHPLVWTDLETSGLDPDKDLILEIAIIVTNGDLQEIACCEYTTDAAGWLRLDQLDPIVQQMHLKSGLWEQSRDSTMSTDKVARLCAEFIDKLGVVKPQLAGSTISFDRGFLRRRMPELHQRLHYRNLDVSTLNEVAKRFWPEVWAGRPQAEDKDKPHRAMLDIRHSIEQLRYYLSSLGPITMRDIGA